MKWEGRVGRGVYCEETHRKWVLRERERLRGMKEKKRDFQFGDSL